MPENEPAKSKRKRTLTVRERTQADAKEGRKPRRLRQTASTIGKPIKKAHAIAKKEYYLPMPENRFGRFLNKRRYWMPRYFINSWRELRQVTWPNRRETFKLTMAVFLFAIVFGVVVALLDYGLDKLFKEILLS